jgi:Xaa-Pro aminopeptidase
VTGQPAQDARLQRLERIAGRLRELELDLLLVASEVNVRYLTGFTGDHGLALIGAGGGPQAQGEAHRFLTDFRYQTQSAEQVHECFEREIVVGSLLEAAADPLRAANGRLGFDDQSLTVSEHDRLRELLGSPCAGIIERLRAVKDAGELSRIRAASELAEEAMLAILQAGLVGHTEREVAIELELRMRRLGAESPSFPSIVAAGAHGALPHAEPRGVKIPSDVLVTIDWGALHEGYCSDCTRTYATGEGVSEQAREVYEVVRRAQERGVEAARSGPNGHELDAVARTVIEQAGYGEQFGHGLGHGVGLEVHEGPRLSRTAGDEPLQAGNVVTIEPGIYLPGLLGVRIEDLVVLAQDGAEVLSKLPKALTVIG